MLVHIVGRCTALEDLSKPGSHHNKPKEIKGKQVNVPQHAQEESCELQHRNHESNNDGLKMGTKT